MKQSHCAIERHDIVLFEQESHLTFEENIEALTVRPMRYVPNHVT